VVIQASSAVDQALDRRAQPVLQGMGVAEIMAQDAPARRDAEHERIDGQRPGQGLGVVEAVPAQAANERIEELGVEEARQHLSRLEPAKAADRVETPTVVSSFAKDILLAPRRYAELFVSVQDFVEHPDGGYFAAWEQPAAYAADLDRAVRLGQ
jgi:hypothetical protein